MSTRLILLFVTVIGLASVGLPDAAQQATFKGGVRTVAVYATATDGAGRLVHDLARTDFEVYDNGKAQQISVFGNDVQPITVVMLLDRSGSMRNKFRLVEEAAEEFVDQMSPADKARIGSFADRIQVDPRDFTSDHDELIKILRTELQNSGPTPLWNAVNVGITALLHQQGRRVVLVFTDGADRPLNFSSSNNNSLKDVMKRAEEEDVMVYAIGLSGHNGPPVGWSRGRAPGPVGRGGWGGGGPGGWGGPGWGGGTRRGGFSRGAEEKPDEGLQKIAAETGGGYFELKSGDELASTFKRVADELHHQYVIGFAPTSLDGKTHKLEVRASSADMRVRARRSYLASTETK